MAPAILGRAGRPLVVSDCDEVLLHMVAHFREWLAEHEGITFRLDSPDFSSALTWTDSGAPVEQREVWRLLRGFFDTEMGRQTPIAGAVEGIAALREQADVVILTNLLDERREARAAQLAALGVEAPVFTNQGPKGPMLARIAEEYGPSRLVFIDDLAQHHRSVRETVPGAVRLHLCGEPLLAPHIACAHREGDAHARIDRWDAALPWLLQQLEKEPE